MYDKQQVLIAMTAEVRRIMAEHTAPYAPRKQDYKKLKRAGTPSLNMLKHIGYSDSFDGWAQFLADHIGAEIEDKNARISRGQLRSNEMRQEFEGCDLSVDTTNLFSNPHDALPNGRLAICSTRQDEHGRVYMMVR